MHLICININVTVLVFVCLSFTCIIAYSYSSNYNGSLLCHLASRLQGPKSFITPSSYRYIIVGDIHGSYDLLKEILDYANITNPLNSTTCEWIKNQSIRLIQLGDVVDRGDKTFEVWYNCLNKLQDESTEAYKLIRLLGFVISTYQSITLMSHIIEIMIYFG